MKKIIALLLVMATCFSLGTPALAVEEPVEEDVSGMFELLPTSRKTFQGNGGYSTLDYLSGGYVRWGISLTSARLVKFEGNLHFNKLGTPFGTFNKAISTTSSSGTEDVRSKLSKGDWEVTLTGVAYGSDGNGYRVVDNATLHFHVSFV